MRNMTTAMRLHCYLVLLLLLVTHKLHTVDIAFDLRTHTYYIELK